MAVVAALAFLLLGSGGAQLGGPIAQAATLSSSTPGYRMHMSMEITSSALSSPVTATGTGVVDLRDHASAFSIVMNLGDEPQVVQQLGGSTMRVEMVLEGATVYMKLPSALAGSLGASGRPWIKADLSKLSGVPGLSSLTDGPTTSDPSETLQELRSVSGTVANLGPQRIDGVETTHYQADLNLDRLADAVPSAERSAMQHVLSTLEQAMPNGALPVDVWIDAQHLVRRTTTTLDLSLPNGPNLQEIATVDLGDYGPQSPPATPPSNQVLDASGLAGAAG
ncbi:MAG TPA: hypothetical protein VMA96_11395 [Solirubrobacteraceae bacterium]|nr:hypothetical protein [Solirubrobacteraceae bacterium]